MEERNLNDFNNEQYLKYIWLMFVAFFGGIIGYFRKQAKNDIHKSPFERFLSGLLSVLTSMFVAYITYEFLIYFSLTESLSVAIAGLASFSGTDLLVTFEEGILSFIVDFIKNNFNKGK